MAAFAALLEKDNCLGAPARMQALSQAIGCFGQQVDAHDCGPLQALCAAAVVERAPAFARSADGVCAIGVVRWMARAELEAALGAARREVADVELLLEAYAHWGAELLDHVQGEFAFALWDPGQHLLLAATDHFGARPLFYAELPDRILVSDSAGALRDSGFCDTTVDANSVGDFLAVGFSTDPGATLYEGIRRLPPGHRLVWRAGKLHVEEYWRIPGQEPLLLYRRPGEYAEQLRELVLRATADRVPPSGRIGVLLSGGMDSTSIAAGLCEALGREAAAERVTGYTFVSRTIREEEGRYAALVAGHLGIGHQKVVIEDMAAGQAAGPARPGSVRAPQPNIDGMAFAASQPAAEIAATGGVIFSGQGGDPLFRPTRQDLLRMVKGSLWRVPFATAYYGSIFGKAPATGARRFVASRLRRGGSHLVPLWLNPDFVRGTALAERTTQYFESLRPGAGGLLDPFWSNLLTLGVSSQTGLSFEPSHPFFDLRILRFVLRLPDPVLRNKRILREAMEPYLPREILERPKAAVGSVMVAHQIDVQQVERQLAFVRQADPRLAQYLDFEILRRCITAAQPETSVGLYRTEAFLKWIAAQD